MKPVETTRVCRHCNQDKPLTEFPVIRGKQFRKCKACTYALTQKWAAERRDRSNAIKRKYLKNNLEKVKAAQREYSTSPRGVQVSRAYKKRNKEKINARYREQYAENPTPFIVRNKRRDERDKQVGGEFTTHDRSALFHLQRGLCANVYCRVDLAVTGFHADHKTPVLRGGSHDPENRQLLCPTCNHRKGTRTNEEWLLVLIQEHKTGVV